MSTFHHGGKRVEPEVSFRPLTPYGVCRLQLVVSSGSREAKVARSSQSPWFELMMAEGSLVAASAVIHLPDPSFSLRYKTSVQTALFCSSVMSVERMSTSW